MPTTLTGAQSTEAPPKPTGAQPSPTSVSISMQFGQDTEHLSLEGASPQSEHSFSGSTHAPETPQGILQQDQYGHMHGGSSEFAFLQFAKQKFSRLPSISIHFSDDPLTGLGGQAAALPPKHIADELVRNFFDFGLPTLRFVHEASFMACYNRLYDSCPDVELSQDNVALVYMVLSLGSHYSLKTDCFRGYTARFIIPFPFGGITGMLTSV